jgi:hypothetical protein
VHMRNVEWLVAYVNRKVDRLIDWMESAAKR